MRFHVLATDYDGTLAHHGVVADETVAALEQVRASGRRLILVTGRELDDMERVFPRLHLFDRVVAENGALLYDPAARTARALAEPPPPEFVQALRARGVGPISVGRVIVATWEPHHETVLRVIREQGLELQVIFNKGAVMVLPSGINKAVGLEAALRELSLSRHNVVGVGDAENDHAFLADCECGVAVANALPHLKERADLVTASPNGAGVRELCEALVRSDLAELGPRLARHDLRVGAVVEGGALTISPYAAPILIAGSSGGGKSTLATSLLEQVAESGYQFCIFDPEGDHGSLHGAIALGDTSRAPSVDEVVGALGKAEENVVVNLLAIPLGDRPAFFMALLPRLLELRARTGRPHWIVAEEAHHLLPRTWHAGAPALPRELPGLLMITVHPEHVAHALLAPVGMLLAVGDRPGETVRELASVLGEPAPALESEALPPGEALVWRRGDGGLARVVVRPPRSERRRHVRKYAAGDLGAERSFYFRGPDSKLNLRAQNLQVFLQVAEGVDDDTWRFHLREHHYSQWFRAAIKDPDLAAEAEGIEATPDVPASESRARVRAAIEARYTAPADRPFEGASLPA